MDARVQLLSTEEAERIPDVDSGVSARTRLDELPCLGLRREHLQAPLLAEEKGDGSDVGVLVVSDVALAYALGVVQHDKASVRLMAIAVALLEAAAVFQAKSVREACEEGVVDEMGKRHEAIEELDLLLDTLWHLLGFVEHFSSRDLTKNGEQRRH